MSERVEGMKPTPEQAVSAFLSLEPDRQLSWMRAALESMDKAVDCFVRNHDEAEHFTRTHVCADRYQTHVCPDHYQEGWNDGLDELQRQFKATPLDA